ncbi:hypothetical protein AVEN_256063-1 [Araneus ventricosus]|uniref:Uncharacterized protein n=1 Tax=Araneus ventricosus TaxID=182803 RepID=A0A4Y2JWK0_ARAVE|nr:hypothetical protein AVEN_256063-1 [Araneus ventricosus]
MLKSYRRTLPELQPGSSVFVQNRLRQWESAEVFKARTKFLDSEEYSTSDAIPDSRTTVRPQEPVDEPASNSQSGQESSSYESISRSPDKGPYRTRYGRVVKPPNRYVAKL